MDLSRYTKLFNYGYFLSKYEPKILRSFLKASENVPEINEPLSAGKAEYQKEQVMDKLKGLGKDSRSGRNMDKGFEPEI